MNRDGGDRRCRLATSGHARFQLDRCWIAYSAIWLQLSSIAVETSFDASTTSDLEGMLMRASALHSGLALAGPNSTDTSRISLENGAGVERE